MSEPCGETGSLEQESLKVELGLKEKELKNFRYLNRLRQKQLLKTD